MIVVDTNIIAAYFRSDENDELIQKMFIRDREWHSPFLWISEFRNVLLLFHRRGLISPESFPDILSEARELIPFDRTHDVDEKRVLALAVRSGCTAYDCEFVALAEALDVPLLTWDKQLLKQFPGQAVTPEGFLKS